VPLVLVNTVTVAELLMILLVVILKISGFMEEAELYELLLLTRILVTLLPTSASEQEEENCVNFIRSGGYNTS
jgi:hypothetical protein